MYLRLSPQKKAEFRDYFRGLQSGENMKMMVYDEILEEEITDLFAFNRFQDRGTWMEERDWEESHRSKADKNQASEKRPMTTKELVDQCLASPDGREDKYVSRYVKDEESNQEIGPGFVEEPPKRNFPREGTPSKPRRLWKQSSLSGADGKIKFGVNGFTAPLHPVNRRMRSEWEKLMPDRSRIVEWARVYRLGHRKIRSKKSVTCNGCHQKISHLPHVLYHTECPNCKKPFFAGVPGLILT
jgi:hypothetical protein